MKYEVSWTRKNGQKIEGQIFTAEHITGKLIELENLGVKDIKIKSIEAEDVERLWHKGY